MAHRPKICFLLDRLGWSSSRKFIFCHCWHNSGIFAKRRLNPTNPCLCSARLGARLVMRFTSETHQETSSKTVRETDKSIFGIPAWGFGLSESAFPATMIFRMRLMNNMLAAFINSKRIFLRKTALFGRRGDCVVYKLGTRYSYICGFTLRRLTAGTKYDKV